MNLTLDTKEFRRAMHEYAVATGKDCADVLNKAGFNILLNPRYGVIRNTPKAKPQEIERELTGPDRIALKISAARLKGASGKNWQKKVGRESRKLVARRKRSSGYVVAGWLQINPVFGGSRKVAAKDQRTKLGDARRASERRLEAVLINRAEGASKVGFRTLQRAVIGAARDMGQYARKKMQKTARRYSSR